MGATGKSFHREGREGARSKSRFFSGIRCLFLWTSGVNTRSPARPKLRARRSPARLKMAAISKEYRLFILSSFRSYRQGLVVLLEL
jgi:hypothetical protein